MQQEVLVPYRQRVVAPARGRVLEVGSGSGLNIPFYPPNLTALYGVEPSATLRRLAQQQHASAAFPITWLAQSAEAFGFADASIDTVVTTWTLCTIADIARALQEIRRVLVPGGQLLFVEHGLAPDARVAAWQRRLTPFWRPLAGGCHLDRDMAALIRAAGFTMATLHTAYVPGPRPWAYFIWGKARRV